MRKNENGFTLIEVVMVIILLGILGIAGTLGLESAVSSDRGMYERQMESAVRYAQTYAMTHFTYAVVVFAAQGSSPSCATGSSSTSYGGYAVCACNGAAPSSLAPFPNPLAQTAAAFYESFNYGITFTASPSSLPNYIAFNSAGQPGTFTGSGACSPPFTPLSAANPPPYVAQFSFGSLSAQSFYIYPGAGLLSGNGSL